MARTMVLQGQKGGSLKSAFLPGTRVLLPSLLLTFLYHSHPILRLSIVGPERQPTLSTLFPWSHKIMVLV